MPLLSKSAYKYGIYIIIMLVGVVSCKSPQATTTGSYKNEKYSKVERIDIKDKSELIVIIPEVGKSDLDGDEIVKSVNKPISIISFLSPDNLQRQEQLNNLNVRQDFYSEVLNAYATEFDSLIVIAEGLNANIVAHIAHAFPIKKAILINPWYPSFENLMLSNCFSEPNKRCDSLLSYFNFTNVAELELLFKAIQTKGSDQIIGGHPLSFWQDVYRYDCNAKANKYKGKIERLFTPNSGIEAFESTYIVEAKELYKRLKSLTNN